MSFIRNLKKNVKGATAIEYGLIAALVAVAIITGAGLLGDSLNAVFSDVADEVDGAV